MSLSVLVGLLFLITVEARGAVSPGSNAPVCSNREGIYVAEEGRPLSVCFIVLNIFATTNVLPEPQTVYFATISESNLGAVATSDIDYVNENRTVTVSVFDQDTIEVCQPVLVNSDSLIERTEYFTVALYVPIVRVSGTCQVAIIDKNGGPSECYKTDETGANISLGMVKNDPGFCFRGNLTASQNSQCQQLDLNVVLADCTSWNPTSLRNVMTSYIVLDQILPSVSAIGEACVANVISILDSVYGGDNRNNINPLPIRNECATNCILTLRNPQTCDTSVLLLQHVYRQEASEFRDHIRSGKLNVCMVGLDCCDLSQPNAPVCSEQPSPVSDSETGGTSSSQLSGAVIAVAVLGVLLGLVLIGGTVVLIIFIVYRYRPTANKEILSALQVMANTVDYQVAGGQDTVAEYNVINRVAVRNTIAMEDNSAYMTAAAVARPAQQLGISTESNVAYFVQTRGKSMYEDDDDYLYDYI